MKFAIVTGASRGLGLALARALLTDGWHVAGMARGEMTGLAGERFKPLHLDLGDSPVAVSALDKLLTPEILANASEICLINNAGVVTPVAQAGNFSTEDISGAVALNLTTPIALTNAFLRRTDNSQAVRRIVNISSGAAHTPYTGWSVYCATKSALDQFTRCIALEQADKRNPLQIASIAPGVVDTDMQTQLRNTTLEDFPIRERFIELHQSGNLQTAAATATKLLAYLASSAFGNPPVVDLRTL